MSAEAGLKAGTFSPWLDQMQEAIHGQRVADVPCNGCTACCTSSQFIHIEPDETETLARIPADLLFPAPQLPRGHVLLGYDELGHCPMLIDNQCSIYENRPRTCRSYDCRVFAATGVQVEGDDRLAIARQASRWQFSYPTEGDRIRHDAVRAAAEFLGDHNEVLADDAPSNPTQHAVLAIEIHDAFLRRDEGTGRMMVVGPDPGAVRVEVMRRRGHDAM